MADRKEQIAQGKELASKFLLLALYVEHFKNMPMETAKAFADSSLEALDELIVSINGNEVFKHSALHEAETFWMRVLQNLANQENQAD